MSDLSEKSDAELFSAVKERLNPWGRNFSCPELLELEKRLASRPRVSEGAADCAELARRIQEHPHSLGLGVMSVERAAALISDFVEGQKREAQLETLFDVTCVVRSMRSGLVDSETVIAAVKALRAKYASPPSAGSVGAADEIRRGPWPLIPEGGGSIPDNAIENAFFDLMGALGHSDEDKVKTGLEGYRALRSIVASLTADRDRLAAEVAELTRDRDGARSALAIWTEHANDERTKKEALMADSSGAAHIAWNEGLDRGQHTPFLDETDEMPQNPYPAPKEEP